MSQEFMTAKQVSTDFFNNECSYYAVLRLTRKGVLPAVKMGKTFLYKREELEKWAAVNFSKPVYAKVKNL